MMQKPTAPRGISFEEHLEGQYTEFVEVYVIRKPELIRAATVYKHATITQGQWEAADINLAPLKTQTPEMALRFITALKAAVKWARWLDERHPTGTVAK